MQSTEGEIIPTDSHKGEIGQMAKMLTPKEIALEWGTTPKNLRKFLRKDEKVIALQGGETPGKAGRWAIPATSLKSLQKRFDAWNEAKATIADESPATPEGDEGDDAPE